jgi:dTDP-4-dehydrorhamnose reductase
MMKIVLFGKNGQLGWEFQRILPILGEVIPLDQDVLDLCDLNAIQKTLHELKPNLIVNASAYTDVDRAEKEVERATTINALAPGVMAETAHQLGAVLVHYSTDYVFDGKKNAPYLETDQPNPLTIYGKSKIMGEENIKQASDAYLILRTSWVYSLRGNSFVNKVLEWSRQKKNLKIVDDQISGPTWARTLAEITSFILSDGNQDLREVIRERGGTYHLAGSGFASRYEWAKEILANDPQPSEQIVQALEPASTEEFPTPAVRPLFSALDCTLFEERFGLRLPDWTSTLRLAMTK